MTSCREPLGRAAAAGAATTAKLQTPRRAAHHVLEEHVAEVIRDRRPDVLAQALHEPAIREPVAFDHVDRRGPLLAGGSSAQLRERVQDQLQPTRLWALGPSAMKLLMLLHTSATATPSGSRA